MTVDIASNGTSPRPLSKIRTSFVTVEKSGQMGLQLRRENSGEPSLARRRTSISIDEEDNPKATVEKKKSIASEFQARKNSLVIVEVIPESAIETASLESDKRLRLPKAKAKLKKTGASTKQCWELQRQMGSQMEPPSRLPNLSSNLQRG